MPEIVRLCRCPLASADDRARPLRRLRGEESGRSTRYRLAILGMVPIVLLLVSLNVSPRLAGLLGLPKSLGILVAVVLAVVGFLVSRAILRREFAQRESV